MRATTTTITVDVRIVCFCAFFFVLFCFSATDTSLSFPPNTVRNTRIRVHMMYYRSTTVSRDRLCTYGVLFFTVLEHFVLRL